jgi:hypothetical protein
MRPLSCVRPKLCLCRQNRADVFHGVDRARTIAGPVIAQAPAARPTPGIAALLSGEVSIMFQGPETRRRTPEGFGDYIKTERAKITKIAKTAGVKTG